MSAHTPGPWTFEATPESSHQDYVVRLAGRDRIPCYTLGDARLIATAPDLLAALQTVDDTIGLLIDLTEPKQDCRELRATIRAALAKAKGE